jgi:hypothetical protein
MNQLLRLVNHEFNVVDESQHEATEFHVKVSGPGHDDPTARHRPDNRLELFHGFISRTIQGYRFQAVLRVLGLRRDAIRSIRTLRESSVDNTEIRRGSRERVRPAEAKPQNACGRGKKHQGASFRHHDSSHEQQLPPPRTWGFSQPLCVIPASPEPSTLLRPSLL